MNKFWLLRPVKTLKSDRDPWGDYWNRAHGFVVRAKTEAEARMFASQSKECGDEIRYTMLLKASDTNPWLDNSLTTCEQLTESGEPGVILHDFRAG